MLVEVCASVFVGVIAFIFLKLGVNGAILSRKGVKKAPNISYKRYNPPRTWSRLKIIRKMAALPATSTALERVKHHHKTAYDWITKALEIDEDPNGEKQEAVEWYIKGIDELEVGLKEKCSGATDDQKSKARKIQEGMKKTLAMARERLDRLLLNDANENGVKLNGTENKHPTKSPKHHFVASVPPKITVKKKAKTDERKPWNHGVGAPARPAERPSSSMSRHRAESPKIVENSSAKQRINLKNIPKEMVNRILDDLIEPGANTISLKDVAGQEVAKQALREIVILPALRPEFFTGLRAPARGLLLFGPPGTGKTMLAKAVAAEAKSNFFNISASTLTSKWVGEGEKMVRALFAVAKEVQPSVIFIDEIDSLLCERKEGESDSVRRLKTEFMMRFDGVESNAGDRILVMGATNRPQELDDAVLRRFPKRVYVSLPDVNSRFELLSMLLKKQNSPLKKQDLMRLAQQTELYSGSDLTELAKDAALGPVREMSHDQIVSIDVAQMRPIQYKDFQQSLKKIRPSVSTKLLKIYERWNEEFGDNSAL